MKKRFILLIISLIAIATLSACGGPSGKYVSENGLSSVNFDGDNITLSFGLVNLNGTYKISRDTLTVNVTVLGTSTSYDYSFSQNSDGSLTIEGEKFTKS